MRIFSVLLFIFFEGFFGPGVLTETTPPLPQLKTHEKKKKEEADDGVDEAEGGIHRLARVI